MRKHVLFLVHGMGVYVDASGQPTTTWSEGVESLLREIYEGYPSLVTPFDDIFEVVSINYDTVFHDLVTRWQTESQTIASAGIEAAEVAMRLTDWLDGGAMLDDNFAWTHAGDVVMYRYFGLVRQRVKIRVANQIHDALLPNNNGAVTRWSVIAHSLGTAVAHDVLHALNATTPNDAGISILDAAVPKPNVIAMLANVSKTLENDVDVYDSVVVPPIACNNYLSANNKFDPFVMEDLLIPKAFKPSGHSTWDAAIANAKFKDVEIENIHEINTHSAANYLRNPAVHVPLLRTLCGSGSIPNSLEQNAIAAFENVPVAALKDQLLDRLDVHKDASWYDAIGVLLPLLETL